MVSAYLLIVLLLAACGSATQPDVDEPTDTPIPAMEEATARPASEAATGAEGQGISGQHTYLIVSEESKASYLVDEEFLERALEKLGMPAGDAVVVGSTQEIEGELQLNLDDLSTPLGTNHFTVALTSLKTDQARRDNWIKGNGPQFNKFPTAEFRATGIEEAPDNYSEGEEVQFKLLGDLTIREVTQPATFDVTASLVGDTITGVATADLLMTDYGFDPPNFANTLTVKNEFQVRVEFTAKEK
jgi:polyisoprenoid-binding protein YceI